MERNLFKVITFVFFAISLSACGGGGGGSDESVGADRDVDQGDDTTPSAPTPEEYVDAIRSLDLSAAEGLIVTRQSGQTVSSNSVGQESVQAMNVDDAVDLEENSVYKVTGDGRLERVPVNDADNNEIPRGAVRPFSVKDINETFVVMTFWVPGLNSGCVDESPDEFGFGCYYEYEDGTQEPISADMIAYLVRKSDGLAFNATQALQVQVVSRTDLAGTEVYTNIRDIRFQSDDLGNLYFPTEQGLNGEQFIRRIDIGNIETGGVTARDLQTSERVWSYAPTSDGRFVIYFGSSLQDQGQNVLRAENLETGEILNLASLGQIDVTGFSNGRGVRVYRMFDGSVYILRDNESPPRYSVYEVETAGDAGLNVKNLGNLALEKTSDSDRFEDFFAFNSPPGFIGDSYDRLVLDGREFITQGSAPIVEIDYGGTDGEGNPAPKVTRHDKNVSNVFDIDIFNRTIRQTRVSGQYAWYFGTNVNTGGDVVLRYDPLLEESTEFASIQDPVTGSELDINDFRVLSSDTVWFEALRLADQATVIGEIGVDGDVTITDVVAADEPRNFVLQPIIPADFLVVDGRVNDWSLEFRVTGDNTDSGQAGNDISYFSQQAVRGNYYGLVEFAGTFEESTLTRVRINDQYELRVWPEITELVEYDPQSGLQVTVPVELRQLGGAASVGQAVEFRIPEAEIGSPAGYALQIDRVGDGDIGFLGADFDAANTEHTLEVGLVTALGDATLVIGLGNDYTLEIDQTDTGPEARVIDDIGTSTVAGNNGGDLGGNPLIIVLSDDEVGNPGDTLSLQELSGEEIFDSISVN